MQDFRRVSVYAADVHVDVTLPAHIPVGSLIPPILNIVAPQRGRDGAPAPTRYRLSLICQAALDPSKTLAQLGIRDGSVLVLSASPTPLPPPRFDDIADAISTSLAAARRRSTSEARRLTFAAGAGWLAAVGALVLSWMVFRANGDRHVGVAAGIVGIAGGIALVAGAAAYRGFRDEIAGLTLGLLASGFAAVAGLLAVPGGPGAPNALLAGSATAVTAVLGLRLIGGGTAIFTAIACFATVAAVAALAAAVGAASLPTIGAASTVASLTLLEMSARVSIRLAGLSPQLAVRAVVDRVAAASAGLSAQAKRADAWLTGLVGAFSTSAAFGAVGTVMAVCASGPRAVGIVFATIIGATLLARSRSDTDMARAVTLAVNGILTVSATFVVAAAGAAGRLPWIAAAMAALPAAALATGFIAPDVTWSPVARRRIEQLEYLMLASLVPLACWICGIYSTARGLTLS